LGNPRLKYVGFVGYEFFLQRVKNISVDFIMIVNIEVQLAGTLKGIFQLFCL
jgi:hypothetical protein